MKKIVIGATEIEVLDFKAFSPDYGRGEKYLKFEVDASVTPFDVLKTALDRNEMPVQYFEDDVLKCEYVGYGVFKSQYENGKHKVDLHMNSIVQQMDALLLANEKLNDANTKLQMASDMLAEQNTILSEQNTMHQITLTEVLESVIPNFLGEITTMVLALEARVSAIESKDFVETETVTDTSVSE